MVGVEGRIVQMHGLQIPLGGPPSQVLPKACITHRRKVLRVHVNCCRALMPTLKGVHAHAYTRL